MVKLPFNGKQVVQGFSSVLKQGDGLYLALSDNGFGGIENSADYLLRLYVLNVNFSDRDESNKVSVENFIQLRDPNKLIPFAITQHFTDERWLTGADFDIESVQRAPDGTLWLGDEFGPFLLHFSAKGILLDAPISQPSRLGGHLRAPQSPLSEEFSALRVMNAVSHKAKIKPIFSPWYEHLRYKGSDSESAARGSATPEGLVRAPADIWSLRSMQKAGYEVVTWTVNDKATMNQLLNAGVNGIISDRPDLLLEVITAYDKGRLLTSEGLIDASQLDAQGHRGARNLRPENTLPSFEAALDHLMNTLELDGGVSKDEVYMLSHEPYVGHQQCRRSNGDVYAIRSQQLIKDCSGQLIPDTSLKDFSYSVGDRYPLAECNLSRL